MSWIESHQEIARHPKTRELSELLGVSLATAVGHLHLLWWWALDYAQDGDLGRMKPQRIADGASWEGDPQRFIGAMVEAGFMDNEEGASLQLHDWNDYAGRLVEKRKANAERMRQARATSIKEPDERATHVQRTSNARAGATVPNSTGPDLTGPDPQNNLEYQKPDVVGMRASVRSAPPAPANERPPEKAKPPERPKRNTSPQLTEEERAQLIAEYGPVLGRTEVTEVIEQALAHQSARKYAATERGCYLYVKRTWLSREVKKQEEMRNAATRNGTRGGTPSPGTGRSLAGAGSARGTNGPIDASARDPREVAKLRELGQL